MSTTVGEIVNVLKGWAPLSLKESWDNPGLLIGSPDEKVDKLMVTLDVMMGTVDYAIEHGIQMIVSHHPVIFDGLKSLRTDTYSGRLYQKLLAHHISVYSAHTNLDSADGGVNDVLARLLGLTDLQGLVPVAEDKLYKIAVYVPKATVMLSARPWLTPVPVISATTATALSRPKAKAVSKPMKGRIPLSVKSAKSKGRQKNGLKLSFPKANSIRPYRT